MEQVRLLFDQHAADWPLKYAPDGPLVGRLSRFETSLAEFVRPPATVLDLGCGSGDLARHLSTMGYRIAAAETSPAMLEAAQSLGCSYDIDWILLRTNWPALPCASRSFDAVVASSLLEYVDRPALVIAECARILRPGGVLLCTVPDVSHRIRRAEAIARMLTQGPASWLRRAWPRRIRSYLDYLRLSKNRFAVSEWGNLARDAGLAILSLDADAAAGASTLALLAFGRRSGN